MKPNVSNVRKSQKVNCRQKEAVVSVFFLKIRKVRAVLISSKGKGSLVGGGTDPEKFIFPFPS